MLYEDRWDNFHNDDHSVSTYVYVCAWKQQEGSEVLVASAKLQIIRFLLVAIVCSFLNFAYSTFEKGRHVPSEMYAVTEVASDITHEFFLKFSYSWLYIEIKFISTIHFNPRQKQ